MCQMEYTIVIIYQMEYALVSTLDGVHHSPVSELDRMHQMECTLVSAFDKSASDGIYSSKSTE